MVGKQTCKAENACVTNVMDGILTMGCLDSVMHWDNIGLCFSAPRKDLSACSYDPENRTGFNRWGVGMCCCRSDSCNELPPEWLALPKWRFRWRALSIFSIVFSISSIGFFFWGKIEGQTTLKKEKKVQCSFPVFFETSEHHFSTLRKVKPIPWR
ncbi:hypothetical protein COOONC_19658 [Cooperia oncophora]